VVLGSPEVGAPVEHRENPPKTLFVHPVVAPGGLQNTIQSPMNTSLHTHTHTHTPHPCSAPWLHPTSHRRGLGSVGDTHRTHCHHHHLSGHFRASYPPRLIL